MNIEKVHKMIYVRKRYIDTDTKVADDIHSQQKYGI